MRGTHRSCHPEEAWFADEGSRLDAFAVAFVAQSFAPALSLHRKMKKGAKFCGLCQHAKRRARTARFFVAHNAPQNDNEHGATKVDRARTNSR
jgi:hypothetical protein